MLFTRLGAAQEGFVCSSRYFVRAGALPWCHMGLGCSSSSPRHLPGGFVCSARDFVRAAPFRGVTRARCRAFPPARGGASRRTCLLFARLGASQQDLFAPHFVSFWLWLGVVRRHATAPASSDNRSRRAQDSTSPRRCLALFALRIMDSRTTQICYVVCLESNESKAKSQQAGQGASNRCSRPS